MNLHAVGDAHESRLLKELQTFSQPCPERKKELQDHGFHPAGLFSILFANLDIPCIATDHIAFHAIFKFFFRGILDVFKCV